MYQAEPGPKPYPSTSTPKMFHHLPGLPQLPESWAPLYLEAPSLPYTCFREKEARPSGSEHFDLILKAQSFFKLFSCLGLYTGYMGILETKMETSIGFTSYRGLGELRRHYVWEYLMLRSHFDAIFSRSLCNCCTAVCISVDTIQKSLLLHTAAPKRIPKFWRKYTETLSPQPGGP